MGGSWPANAKAVLREEGPQAVRIVITAVVGWQICIWLGAQQAPFFAALVPVVAVRDDPFAAINVSAGRLVGVIAGVLLGAGVLLLLPPNAVSVALVLSLGLLLGIALRIGGKMNIQVGVSALMVLGSTDSATYGWNRLWETGVGVITTFLLAPLLLPSSPYPVIRDQLTALAGSTAQTLRAAAALAGTTGNRNTFDDLAGRAAVDEDIARALPHQVAQGMKALRFHVWRRGDIPRLDALTVPAQRSYLVAAAVREFVDELADFQQRPEHEQAWRRSHQPLVRIAEPLATVIEQDLTGEQRSRDHLNEAREAIVAYRDTDPAALPVVVRHPLRQLIHELDTEVPGARPSAR